ncbi:hypothetical protein V6N11_011929 [Hibiscus sabdariffa]|uniref:Uncharacterized protein n=1 Tax=Hibiscus sabdariffa TaxID=183260 RepID=A0ABR2SAK4_9ROSI
MQIAEELKISHRLKVLASISVWMLRNTDKALLNKCSGACGESCDYGAGHPSIAGFIRSISFKAFIM